jgi:hypothetical protein
MNAIQCVAVERTRFGITVFVYAHHPPGILAGDTGRTDTAGALGRGSRPHSHPLRSMLQGPFVYRGICPGRFVAGVRQSLPGYGGISGTTSTSTTTVVAHAVLSLVGTTLGHHAIRPLCRRSTGWHATACSYIMRLMADIFIERRAIVHTVTSLVANIGTRVARLLVTGPTPSLIVAGTLACAGFGAVILNGAPSADSSSQGRAPVVHFPVYCGADTDGDGNTMCVGTLRQLSAYESQGCQPFQPFGSDYVCYFRGR